MERGFDKDNWTRLARKWDNNRIHLGFHATVACADGHLAVKIENCPKQYYNAAVSLVYDVAAGAILFMRNEYVYPIAAKDREEESRWINQELSRNISGFLDILLNRGLDDFKKISRDHVSVLRARYEINHLTYADGIWRRWNGDIWNGQRWVNGNGEEYEDAFVGLFHTVLPDRKAVS